MTEFWVSQKRHWCEYCKVWLNDTISARTTHENGLKHKENVARKLREMRQKGEAEKKEAALLKSSWDSIEAKAKAQYEKDVKAGLVAGVSASDIGGSARTGPGALLRAQREASRAAAEEAADRAIKASAEAEHRLTGGALSKWEPDAASGYLYNAALRYYHDTKSGWYYGGDPPAWTENPPIPEVARYQAFYQQQPEVDTGAGPQPRGALGTTVGSGVATAAAAPAANPTANAATAAPRAAAAAVAGAVRPAGVKRTVAVAKAAAPQAMHAIGGHQLHQLGGKIGAARGLGVVSGGVAKQKKAAGPGKGKAVSKEEAAALARREAARARVEKRTMSQFGL